MVSIELQAPSNYLDELTHVDMIRHQEFRFIQDWKLLLTFVSFYYYRDFGRMLLSDEPDIFYSLFEGSALFEGFLGRHVAAGWAAATAEAAASAAAVAAGAEEEAPDAAQEPGTPECPLPERSAPEASWLNTGPSSRT